MIIMEHWRESGNSGGHAWEWEEREPKREIPVRRGNERESPSMVGSDVFIPQSFWYSLSYVSSNWIGTSCSRYVWRLINGWQSVSPYPVYRVRHINQFYRTCILWSRWCTVEMTIVLDIGTLPWFHQVMHGSSDLYRGDFLPVTEVGASAFNTSL